MDSSETTRLQEFQSQVMASMDSEYQEALTILDFEERSRVLNAIQDRVFSTSIAQYKDFMRLEEIREKVAWAYERVKDAKSATVPAQDMPRISSGTVGNSSR